MRIEAEGDGGLLQYLTLPLKRPAHRLIWTHSLQVLQHWDNRDIWGKTELSSIRARVKEAAFSQTKVLEDAIVLFLSLSPTEPQRQQAGTISKIPSTWLFVCPTMVIP